MGQVLGTGQVLSMKQTHWIKCIPITVVLVFITQQPLLKMLAELRISPSHLKFPDSSRKSPHPKSLLSLFFFSL